MKTSGALLNTAEAASGGNSCPPSFETARGSGGRGAASRPQLVFQPLAGEPPQYSTTLQTFEYVIISPITLVVTSILLLIRASITLFWYTANSADHGTAAGI
jgi:hypothetical protein